MLGGGEVGVLDVVGLGLFTEPCVHTAKAYWCSRDFLHLAHEEQVRGEGNGCNALLI